MCLGVPAHLPMLKQIGKREIMRWTCRKEAVYGDIAAIYLTAPISSIVGYGMIYSEPEIEEESDWADKYFADIGRFRLFAENDFVPIRRLKELFPEWKYLAQPRRTGIAPDAITGALVELLRQTDEQN